MTAFASVVAPSPYAPIALWIDDGRRAPGLLDPEEAAVAATDRGLLTGHGVFETMAVLPEYGPEPFALTRHLARLRRSARICALQRPDEPRIRAAIRSVVGACADPDGAPVATRVRVTWTAGPAPHGPCTLLVTAAPHMPAAPCADVALVPWRRNPASAVAGAKTTSYAENAVAMGWARSQGCDEGVFATVDGLLCEGSTSNVFVSLDGRLVTPSLATGCLPGVTRGLVLEWCGAQEQDGPATALLEAADEVFLTSASRWIQPVHRVLLPNGRVRHLLADEEAAGPVTEQAMAAFMARAATDPDPAPAA